MVGTVIAVTTVELALPETGACPSGLALQAEGVAEDTGAAREPEEQRSGLRLSSGTHLRFAVWTHSVPDCESSLRLKRTKRLWAPCGTSETWHMTPPQPGSISRRRLSCKASRPNWSKTAVHSRSAR